MVFINAFLICGVICCIGQFLLMNTKIGFVGLFALLMVAGTVLGALGLFGPMVGFGMMGVIVTIMALCEQFFECFLGAFHGDASGLILFVGVVLCIVVAAAVCGAVAKLPHSEGKKPAQ